MAAQNQSKASDQWSLFQAKRIRGTEVQRTIRLLQALSEPAQIDALSLEAVPGDFIRDLRRIEKETDRFLQAVASAGGALGSAAGNLSHTATRLKKELQDRITNAQTTSSRLKQELARKEIRDALPYLTSNELPPVSALSIQGSDIAATLEALRVRRPDTEISALASGITDAALGDAIRLADENVGLVEEAGKPVASSLDRLDTLLEELVTLPRAIVRSVGELNATVSEIAPSENKAIAPLSSSAATITSLVAALRATANQWRQDMIVARDNYSVRRYEREARANETAAALIEIQVRKNDLKSERHRGRSKLFFYGMLAAQAGVTIASFSLALKHRSLLWSLASLAGLGAVLFGIYVYLYM
jgi:hypothetical protein